ncbi:hypothetical protein [Maribacter sp. 2304DJ31-5]|uniref:hypothetical protein n=1 Tax=Maribacter sp. 2304DJ31-5 TaxID=3386273 RepID=UPI0039BCC00B
MIHNLLKRPIVLYATISIGFMVTAQKKQKLADKDTFEWEYDIECYGGTAKHGFKLVKIWSYSKEKSIATAQAKKNAVHGIIFKGYAGEGRGCRSSRPLMNREMTDKEYKDFFKDFFSNDGNFNRFVTYASNHKGVTDVQKLVKKKKEKREKFHQYKIGVVVRVASDELRKHLEKKGMINSLAKGF